MQPCDIVDAYFQNLLTRCDSLARATDLSRNDQIIYYIIATRCEIDLNGFDSVFDQLLNEDQLRFLISALNDLGETELAQQFDSARVRLTHLGFFDDDSLRVSDFISGNENGFLADIEEGIRENDALLSLDDKLVSYIPATGAEGKSSHCDAATG